MPSIGQIIPDYQQPYVATYINDNTIPTETPNPALAPVRALQVFTSAKGRDNQLIQTDTLTDYLSEYGNPNFALFGQPGYMPAAYLSTNQARVYTMRIMPDDAAYSNIIILAKVKVDTSGTSPKLVVRYQAEFFPNVAIEDDFPAMLEAIENETPDVDGFLTYPLFVFYSAGRGVYGDMYRVRISSHTQADKDNVYKNYRIELFSTENGFDRIEMFEAALYPDAIQSRVKSSYFLEDIIHDNSSKIKCVVYQAALEKIYNIYKASVDPATTYTTKDIDIVFGINKYSAELDPTIFIDKLAPSAVALDKIEGVVLTGGDDGVFAVTTDPDTRAAAINAMYILAFQGKIDKRILSKRRLPCELIMDANYEDSVKRTLINLIIQRYDAYGYVDAGLLKTATEAQEWGDYMQDIGDRIFSKECQNYKIKDPYTGKVIPVTMTYFLAGNLPTHFKNVGNQVPFVGDTYARLTGYIKNSLLPVIDADDLDVKEVLYDLRVNFFQAISEDVYVRTTQSTSQFSNSKTTWSDLSEENNMNVLLEMKRALEIYVAAQIYNFADFENRRKFTEDVTRMFTPYTSVKVASFDVRFEMNAWEEERSILHCYLEVVFRSITKRAIIEIDINKRA
jgi:hypothetical protein